MPEEDDVNYQENWDDEEAQCQNCKFFQSKDDKNACVPQDMNFEQALAKFGEVSPAGHCNYFAKK